MSKPHDAKCISIFLQEQRRDDVLMRLEETLEETSHEDEDEPCPEPPYNVFQGDN